jgi:drug/metabolite transporter (DMT)-like permease
MTGLADVATGAEGYGVTLAVVFALVAAFSNAVNLLTQHAASIRAPKQEKGWRLGLYLARQPLWLLGGAAAVGSYVFQALALHNGPMSVVQPVLITELIFVLVLRRVWIRQDLARAAWAAVFIVCASLAVFLTAAEPTGGKPAPATAEWLSAVLVVGGAVALLAAVGWRGNPVRRAAAFAAAAALTWAMEATFLKAATDTLASFGIAGMLIRWPVYALVGAVLTGTLLQQTALHVGPLSVSQPILVITDPFASIILSVWLFDERFTNSPVKIAIAIVAFAVMAFGVTVLTRTAPQDLDPAPPSGPSPAPATGPSPASGPSPPPGPSPPAESSPPPAGS